jgi:type II secretory pathway pseudopilin PulG
MTFKRMHKTRSSSGRVRPAYSLLELLLALGLSVAIFSFIAMAIRINLIALTKQQKLIERKQVARSIIELISNDCRAAIQYKAADYSGLENLLETQQLMTNSIAPSEDDDEEEEAEEEEIIAEDEVSFRPTLIGNSQVLMLDISRLPRVDQYNPLIASADDLVASPSDVKSVAYFAADVKGGQEAEIEFQAAAEGGLYRREIDRAVAAYMGDYELISQPDQYTKLLAPEVAQLTFRYFDGEDWQSEWDSADAGGFPLAIEITVVVDASRMVAANYDAGEENQETHVKVVHLPVAEPPPEE